MGFDIPDGPQPVMTVSIVAGEPTQETETTETLIIQFVAYEGTAQTNQTLATWTVATDKVGNIYEIEMASDNYPKTRFTLEVDDVAVIDDEELVGPLTLVCGGAKMPAASKFEVFARSSDGTSIKAEATIVGKEVG